MRGTVYYMKRFAGLILAAAMLCGLCGCGGTPADPDKAPESIQVIAMDTVMIFSVYGEKSTHAAYAAEDEMRRLEDLLSRTDEESQIFALNSAGGQPVTVDSEVSRLLNTSGMYSDVTGGAFDITIAPVVSAWGFTTDSYQVPARADLEELLTHVGMEHVHQSGDSVRLDQGTQIDLGGIAKGYASDRVAQIFAENNIPRATAALGGNVLAWGDRPDETPWRVGIQDPKVPDDRNTLACLLHLTDAFAVTSGGYQRYFEEDGKTYQHIIDPATGYPADSGLTSVTVVADCDRESLDGLPGAGTMCDALSTALYVMGEDEALDFWRNCGLDIDLVLVTADDRVVVTAGLADAYEAIEGSGYTYEVVS